MAGKKGNTLADRSSFALDRHFRDAGFRLLAAK